MFQPVRVMLLALLLTTAAGCRGQSRPLRLQDLTPAESRYVTRFVVLERAKAVALADRRLGDALLDSLAAAWGDSALSETLAGLPADPVRAGRLQQLLGRVLAAEADSLLEAPRADRLGSPLGEAPAPAPPDTAAAQ